MTDHYPQRIPKSTWDEIAAKPDVRAAWGLADEESGADMAAICYGAKFTFGPGWAGDLFIIHDDAFGGPPFVLRRAPGGALESVSYQ